jgi:hypothetical protein
VEILSQFLYRLSLGLAAAMAATSPRWVTSGYYRVHLYVLLGLNVLASAVALSRPVEFRAWPALVGAVLSYVGSVLWLYEARWAGRVTLAVLAVVALAGAWFGVPAINDAVPRAAPLLDWFDPLGGGLVLGTTMAAMLLGHWYLNTPTMQLDPLRRLIVLMLSAVGLRALVCLVALAVQWHQIGPLPTQQAIFLALRWLAGLLGTAVVAVMAWQTLKIPNTQSATGILYVGVITTFLGELTALLLAAETAVPL